MIRTERLELVPATDGLLAAAIESPAALAAALDAHVPPTWPPEYLDAPALDFTRHRMADDPGQSAWWMYFMVLPRAAGDRVLIGSTGYKGPPSEDGTVEIGYAVVSDYRRRGYASESVRGLVKHAFGTPAVRRVVAETLPELTPSIGVLHQCGFEAAGEGSEPGVIRFELTRAAYVTKRNDRTPARRT